MDSKPDSLSLIDPELASAMKEFKFHYEMFAKKYTGRLVRIEADAVEGAIEAAKCEGNIRSSAASFETKIGDILSQIKETQQTRAAKWKGKLRTFISKLYPLATTCCLLVRAFAGVESC